MGRTKQVSRLGAEEDAAWHSRGSGLALENSGPLGADSLRGPAWSAGV